MRTRRAFFIHLPVVLVVAACGSGSQAVRATSSSLDDLLKGLGASTRHVDDALVYTSDDLVALRKSTGASDDEIQAVAQRLDSHTTTPQRVEAAVARLNHDEAADALSFACDLYDAENSDMTPDERAAFMRSLQVGLAGYSAGVQSAVQEAVEAFRAENDLAAAIARISVCQAADAVALSS